MSGRMFSVLPVPPALVYLLHQLRENHIGYRLYGEVPNSDMVFVDIDVDLDGSVENAVMPEDWSLISPHFLSQRALERGEADPIRDSDSIPEAIVIAYGGREAEAFDHFQALCEQVRYLRQQTPSRLVYNNKQPPQPEEIQQLIQLLKAPGHSK